MVKEAGPLDEGRDALDTAHPEWSGAGRLVTVHKAMALDHPVDDERALSGE